jgi:hypothetical protein
VRIKCKQVTRRKIECVVRVKGATSKTTATARVKGARSSVTRRGTGKVRLRVTSRKRVSKSTRVVVRYTAGSTEGRVIVGLGKQVKVTPR